MIIRRNNLPTQSQSNEKVNDKLIDLHLGLMINSYLRFFIFILSFYSFFAFVVKDASFVVHIVCNFCGILIVVMIPRYLF